MLYLKSRMKYADIIKEIIMWECGNYSCMMKEIIQILYMKELEKDTFIMLKGPRERNR